MACAICELASAESNQEFDTGTYTIMCRRCGKYRATEGAHSELIAIEFPQPSSTRNVELALSIALSPDSKLLPFLSAATRQASEEGSPLELRESLWRSWAAAQERLSVSQKARKALEHIGRKSSRPGAEVAVDVDVDYPVVGAVHPDELGLYLGHLAKNGLITPHTTMSRRWDTSLTMAGWEELEPLRKSQVVRGRVFVARWFDDDLDEAYLMGIKAAIEDPDVGCEAVMLKESRDPTNINNEMLAEITRAEFVVADLTRNRPNVYFEAGYAMALGRKVIFTCQAAQPDGVHFDTAPFRRIEWQDPGHLFRELKATLIWLKGQRSST
jgi:hypothetical protein